MSAPGLGPGGSRGAGARAPAGTLVAPVVALLALASACGAPDAGQPEAGELAASVTIHRDAHGVPHVLGETPAATAFGYAYAQAEDNFWQVEDNFIRAVGRSAEVHGEPALLEDWINRALEIPRLAREEYRGADPEMKALLDGFAAGFNHFVRTRPDVEFRLLERVEPWHALAFIRYVYYQRGFRFAADIERVEHTAEFRRSTGLDPGEVLARGADPLERGRARRDFGSNSWAVSPSRSASGNALLFINPHLPFFGPSQVYEGHVMSRDGWNFTGYGRFGFPLPYIGFGETLGWMSTDNYADQTDVYAERFDDAEEPLAYRYGDGWRIATAWTDTLRARTDDGVVAHAATFRKTHHGAVLALRDGRPLAVRMARFREPGWLQQWYDMTRARSVDELRDVVSRRRMLFGNVLAADRDGDIFYVYNSAVPVRSEAYDWSEPVDGSDPGTEWDGYHPLDELPQLLNPATGWLQNCNSTPFLSTARENPDPADFPSYMVTEGDTPRSREARRILSGRDDWTFEAWADASYATHVQRAEEEIPPLVEAWRGLEGRDLARARALEGPVRLLERWDRVSTVESEAMTLFVFWGERYLGGGEEGPSARLRALEEAVDALEADWDGWRVAWGEVNRLQRIQSGLPEWRRSGPGQVFGDARPSLASPGVPSWGGGMFTFNARPAEDGRRRYGVSGNSYVAVVEFGDRVRARTLHPFGASADPDSPHFFDQAPLYVAGEYKRAWLTPDQVEANAERSYRPGREDRPGAGAGGS